MSPSKKETKREIKEIIKRCKTRKDLKQLIRDLYRMTVEQFIRLRKQDSQLLKLQRRILTAQDQNERLAQANETMLRRIAELENDIVALRHDKEVGDRDHSDADDTEGEPGGARSAEFLSGVTGSEQPGKPSLP